MQYDISYMCNLQIQQTSDHYKEGSGLTENKVVVTSKEEKGGGGLKVGERRYDYWV